MPVPKPNPAPPFKVVRASHVESGVRDLARAAAWFAGLSLREPALAARPMVAR